MEIGIPRERKPEERRVALVPEAVTDLVRAGHIVHVEAGAGLGSGYADADFEVAGASLAPSAEALSARSRLIVKVKEPIAEEYDFFRPDHWLFSFLHLAAVPDLAEFLTQSGVTALAFETLEDGAGGLPLLAPMSAIAGKVAAQYGLTLLHAPQGGRGVMLGGSPGTSRGRAVVMGAGVVGSQAAELLSAVGARVDVFDLDLDRADQLARFGPGQITGLYPYRDAVSERLRGADVLVGAVLSTVARAPVVVAREDVAAMGEGAVVADVAVDQGGCVATTRPTDYAAPTYTAEGVTHFAVTNMPAATPRSATQSLSARLLPYVQRLASLDPDTDALPRDLATAVNVRGGSLVHRAVSDSLGT